ncbi:hypothetical protein MSAN_01875600 [Mycena sanguinolenta]|uniref:Cytochrome P450 n=1 Tax=Mycena sanguinolenta TaxID=230812 RepID=A0A8H6XUD5_9AGAR|nr:hypothetical protein MSAN_01875600 [Mycena sanguinolenta]
MDSTNTDFINAFTQGFLSQPFAVNLDPGVKLRHSIAPVRQKWFRGTETDMLFNKSELNTPDTAPMNTSSVATNPLLPRTFILTSGFLSTVQARGRWKVLALANFRNWSGILNTRNCIRSPTIPMTSADYLLAVAVSSIFLAVVGFLERRKAASRLPFPPGPKPRFLAGNLFDIPTETAWITYTEWGKQYGDVVHAQMLGKHVVILNSVKAATDLLEKRATIYSDRPTMPIVPLTGWGFNLTFMSHTDEWRERRRLFHQHFRPDAAAAYRPVQLRKIQDLLRGLLSTPEDFVAHIKTMTAAIILDTIRTAFAKTSELVDEVKNAPFDFVKQNMRNGSGKPSVLRELLEQNDAHGSSEEREQVIKDVAGVAYAGGADTTRATLTVFIMAMMLNPEVAKKAQNELDAVVGPGFLPGFEHRSALPYCEAVFREVFRWGPILPLAVPHTASEDDIYEGYFIPKGYSDLTVLLDDLNIISGTTVIPNVWAMGHDESKYSNPDEFNPERFLNSDGQLNTDDHILGFGFGRRICVGRHAADAIVWATIVSVLSTFDIAKPKDATGKEIEIEPVYVDGLLSYPKPFQCSITPRNDVTRQLIESMTDV